MKKYLLILSVLVLFSCQKYERLVFESKPGLYFALEDNKDTLAFSLLGTIVDKDTVKVPVKIMGNTLQKEGKFKVEIIPEATTAVAGKHYTKLKEFYVFEAGLFEKELEIEVSKSDPELEKVSKTIALRIIESDDFTVGYTKNSIVNIIISNQLIKPSYYDMPMSLYFGSYSKVKHNLIIRIVGHDFPLTLTQAIRAPYSIQYWIVAGRAACQYVIENDLYDENGVKIMPWSTF